jgi:transaldolase
MVLCLMLLASQGIDCNMTLLFSFGQVSGVVLQPDSYLLGPDAALMLLAIACMSPVFIC